MADTDLDLKCLCIEVRNAAQALSRLYDAELAPAGISVTQLSQLNQVNQLGNPTLKALALATRLDRSTLGRNLRLMESQGLVTIAPGRDARTREVKLTRKGKRALNEGAPLWYRVQNTLSEKLGAEKRAQLSELLDELTLDEDLKHG